MVKFIYALLAGVVGGVVTAFAGAVVLGIVNIYLTGHGIMWPGEEFNWHFISMSLLDLILIAMSFAALVVIFTLVIKSRSRGNE